MQRDKIKSAKYFTDLLAEDLTRSNNFENKLSLNEVKVERISAIKRTIFSINIGILVAKFSSGENLAELIPLLKKEIFYAEESWNAESGYVEMLWMLSMGIMLGIEDMEFNKLVVLVDRDILEDYIIDYLITYRVKGRKISEKIEFDNPYKSIVQITKSSKEDAQSLLKKYLEREWYKGHNDSYWYDNHKSDENIYFGYWSFEAGAIVKIMSLDDNSFKDNQYYPYDMVHCKD